MIVPSKFNGYNSDGTRNLFMGGGGGGGPTQTTSTVQNTNIPEYAKGYVENMLGATQKQLFNTTDVAAKPATYDDQGNQLTAATEAGTTLDSFKPYQAYGGTYDPKTGEQLSYDPSKGIAKINDMQQQAYMNMYGMRQDPNFNVGSQMAQQAGQGAMASADKAYGYGAQGQQSGLMGQGLGIAGGQKYGEMGAGYGAQGAGFGSQAAGLADPALAYGAKGAGYGDTGAGYGAQAAQLANRALDYGQGSADIGQMALRAQDTGNQIGAQAQKYAAQAAAAGQNYATQATDPNAMKAYMSPYMQNVVDVQNEEARRQSKIAGTQQQAEAAKAGAFGGGRDAIMRAERERNLATIMNQNTAQGQQAAFQQAQQAQQYGANLGLQGLTGAQQGLGTALQGGQLGLSGLGTALQGQQGALSGVGQAGAMYGLGMQGAQTGIQGTQAGLAGVNAANQAYQTGIQGAQTGIQGAQTGLQGVDRQLAGTAQGMQGAQVGLQGVTGAQAGYGLANQAGANVANIANQSQAAQQALYNNQMAMGDKKMAYDQSILNQAVQDYANAQQYPLMQLGTMSNMLRGLPMQASTTNQYAAAPSAASQAIGTIGSGASIYNAMKPGGAAGGLPSEFKYAKGGIMSYDMGGEVEDQLENMDEKGLAAQAKESTSPSIRKMAQRILRERQMSKPQGADAANVQYQAAQPQMPAMRGGGIIAFKTGGGANEEGGEDEAKINMQERLDQPAPTTGGIMGATTQPTTQVPYAPQAGRAVQAAAIPDFMKAQFADTERRQNQSLADIMAEKKAAYAAEGVADAAAGQQEQRAGLMAEKANLTAENERTRNLRMASFFAKWGSTPGPVLVAGMNALKESVPDIISDEKEQKKIRRDIDKSIADLDNATRLEKRGEIDNAMAVKLKAAEDMKALQGKLIDYQTHKETNERALEASKYTADMHFKSEQLRSQTAHLDRVANRETADDNKRFNAYSVAAQNEMRVINKITDQASGGQYKKDLDDIKTARMTATDEKGNFDSSKVPAPLRPAMEAAEARVAAQQEVWNKQKEQAARDTELAYKRVRIRPEDATKDYTGGAGSPAPTGGPVSGEFSAPTAAHIAALKANPTQKAAFDAKFGPGAANEYLGK